MQSCNWDRCEEGDTGVLGTSEMESSVKVLPEGSGFGRELRKARSFLEKERRMCHSGRKARAKVLC